ncbi:MAG: hypothetical protein SV375_16645 [Thermodesulfobacteriota bacterium]|nr:hypothetical protein [Thermodesulfobacteriota bacterium]
MSYLFWWIRQIILTLTGCFFLLFGVHLLIAAYRLNNPFWFIMTFFASNLIILISGALVVGFVIRMISVCKSVSEMREREGEKRIEEEERGKTNLAKGE